MITALDTHYAQALADAVFGERSDLPPIDATAQLASVTALIKDSNELTNALLSPAVPRARKENIINKITEQAGLHRLVRNFLMLVVRHRRVNQLGGIQRSFEDVVDARLGFVRADIQSASTLAGEEKEELERSISARVGKKIRPFYAVNDSLLGGVLVRVGSQEFDGSLRGRLESIRQRLSLAS